VWEVEVAGYDRSDDAGDEPVIDLLHRELREARAAALGDGADPDEVTADLAELVHRLQALNERGWPPS
jgi:hypothetical protein